MSDSDDRLEDDDFDFKKKQNKDNKKGADIKTEKIENQHMDERIELDSEGQSEEIQSNEEEEDDDQAKHSMDEQNTATNKNKSTGRQNYNRSEEDEQEYDAKSVNIPGAYNPADYAHLDVSNEIKELFRYITRYQPETKELEAKLRPFIPDFYPTIGEVDAYIKMAKPDGKEENLGLQILDEPCLNQSNRAVVGLIYNIEGKSHGTKNTTIHDIKNAEKNPKEIQNWINSVAEVRKSKQPHSVSYTKPMPEIDELMQEWPQEIEEILQHLNIPSEELDLNLADFCKLACAILDIPVHETPNNSSIIESLHVFFTLYSEFKSNQHFQQNKNDGNYDQMQLQIN